MFIITAEYQVTGQNNPNTMRNHLSTNNIPQIAPIIRCCCSVTNSCLTLCDPVSCSPPGSSVQGVLQARVLELGCHCFLHEIFPDQGLNPHLLHWQVDFFPTEPPGKLIIYEGVITKVNKAYVLFSKSGENRQEAVLDMKSAFL